MVGPWKSRQTIETDFSSVNMCVESLLQNSGALL